jgi:hypothetical protein
LAEKQSGMRPTRKGNDFGRAMILFCSSGISSGPTSQAPTPSDQAFVPGH